MAGESKIPLIILLAQELFIFFYGISFKKSKKQKKKVRKKRDAEEKDL
jgi:hypothetical protein